MVSSGMALIPTFYADCVVAIGSGDFDSQGNRNWIATGFWYGHKVRDLEDDLKEYKIYLVTNRHVVQGRSEIYLRFNPQPDEPARERRLDLVNKDGDPLWFFNPVAGVDIAVISPGPDFHLKGEEIRTPYFRSDEHTASVERMNELGVTEGDFAYVLGFPLGIVGDKRNAVIVRSGCIARIRDALVGANQTFLVDAFVFPGNSGSPVVSKPERVYIKGTKSLPSSYLIGIVRSYIGRQRVAFEENTGLTEVHPVDLIEETIQMDLKATSDQRTT